MFSTGLKKTPHLFYRCYCRCDRITAPAILPTSAHAKSTVQAAQILTGSQSQCKVYFELKPCARFLTQWVVHVVYQVQLARLTAGLAVQLIRGPLIGQHQAEVPQATLGYITCIGQSWFLHAFGWKTLAFMCRPRTQLNVLCAGQPWPCMDHLLFAHDTHNGKTAPVAPWCGEMLPLGLHCAIAKGQDYEVLTWQLCACFMPWPIMVLCMWVGQQQQLEFE